MTKAVNIHASCIAIGRHGVLLLGKSGAGKSDLALRLIDDGARLVADDRCDLSVRRGKLTAAAPAAIAGLIEVRGIGILGLPHLAHVNIALAVQLSNRSPARLPAPAFYTAAPRLGALPPVPQIVVNPRHASAPAKIRAALAAFLGHGFRDTFNPLHKGNIRL